jgi:hypothetical protein
MFESTRINKHAHCLPAAQARIASMIPYAQGGNATAFEGIDGLPFSPDLSYSKKNTSLRKNEYSGD